MNVRTEDIYKEVIPYGVSFYWMYAFRLHMMYISNTKLKSLGFYHPKK